MNKKNQELLTKRGNAIVAFAMFVGFFSLPTYIGFFFAWEAFCLIAWAYNRFSKQNSLTYFSEQNVVKTENTFIPPWEDPVFRERLDPLSLENLYFNPSSLTYAND
jgi:hypothetical protein